MRVRTLSSLFVVVAILFIMAVAAQVFVDDLLHPSSVFGYLFVTTLITGVLASAITEKINMRITGS